MFFYFLRSGENYQEGKETLFKDAGFALRPRGNQFQKNIKFRFRLDGPRRS